MKTNEFIRKIEELGYGALDGNDYIRVRRYRDSGLVAVVYKIKVKALNTNWDEYISDDLFDVLFEYTRTPLAEREDVKKY